MNTRTLMLTVLLAALSAGRLVLLPTAAEARAAEIHTAPFSKLAVGGYDPVAYFETGKPVRGLSVHTTDWKGAAFRFATPEALAKFRADPARYAPQYGGYCAWAVSQGYRAKGDPRYWRIVGGKLYLNYNAEVQQRWEADIPGFVAKADRNWPGVLD
jgi:YHS domain-containing protein